MIREWCDAPWPRPHDSYARCSDCCGSGIDRKKRTRKCPTCRGSGSNSNICGVCYKKIHYGMLTEDVPEALCKCEFDEHGVLKKK